MWKSITETLKKINTELKGGAFLSIILTLILLSLFVGYKILAADYPEQKDNLVYQVADIQNSPFSFSDKSHFIYASSRGTKYYYFNCKYMEHRFSRFEGLLWILLLTDCFVPRNDGHYIWGNDGEKEMICAALCDV
jgi:hypothetical protein